MRERWLIEKAEYMSSFVKRFEAEKLRKLDLHAANEVLRGL